MPIYRDELSPLAAYEELMRFAKKAGEAALRLAMHASVPQGFHPNLLHLLRRNFVPETGNDSTSEVDVLFSPICEDLGRGYFRFDPQARTLLLDNLAANYAEEPTSRIYRVANFLLFFVEHIDRTGSGTKDQLWRDYLETQRWVGFAFVNPEGAAQQLAAALEHESARRNFVARMQLGGLASALAAPLVGYGGLLRYAQGIHILESGNEREAEELFAGLSDYDLQIGDTTLRSPARILEEWHERHQSPGESRVQPVEEVVEVEEPVSEPVSKFDQAVINLTSKNTDLQRGAAEFLRAMNAPVVLVLGRFVRGERDKIAETIKAGLERHSYVPIFPGDAGETFLLNILSCCIFVIAEISDPRRVRSQLKSILPAIKIPVQPLLQSKVRLYETFSELQRYPALLKPHRYTSISRLSNELDEIVIPELESLREKTRDEEPKREGSYECDVYISYAHLDNSLGWVDSFHRALETQLHRLLGRPLKICRDVEFGGYVSLLDSGLKKTALFIFVCTPAYLQSEWSQRELNYFLSESQSGFFKNSDQMRVFKVLKTPVSQSDLGPVLGRLLGYTFYDTQSGQVREFAPEQGGFENEMFYQRIADLARDISSALSALSGTQPDPVKRAGTVYLAATTSELNDLRDQIKRELEERNYSVLPDRPLSLTESGLVDEVRSYVERSDISVHLVGDHYGLIPEEGETSVPVMQYRIAALQGIDRIVWMKPGLQPDNFQREFVAELRNANDIELLERSFAELKAHIIDRLNEKRLPPHPPQTTPAIYLIDDPRDAETSNQIARWLHEQQFIVLRMSSLEKEDNYARHRDTLEQCDFVLIYWGHSSELWLRENLRQVQRAAIRRSTPLEKAIYIGPPRTPQKELYTTGEHLVIKDFRTFQPSSLEPIVELLRSNDQTFLE